MVIIKRISKILLLSLVLNSTTPITTQTIPSFGEIASIAAGGIIGYITGYSFTQKKFSDKRIFHLGGAAGCIIGGIYGLELYRLLYPPQKTTSAEPNEQNQKNKLYKSTDSTPVKMSDIIGLENVINDIKQVIDCIKHPESYKKFGAKLPKGILLEGPPGSGKTMIAKAMAHEAGCAFFEASATDFEDQYIGVGAHRIRELFDNASKHKPAIIFIDEIDAIGSRTSGQDGDLRRQTINQLLCKMDGFKDSEGIFILAATNCKECLDPALLRAGRFDRHIKVPLPDVSGRYTIAKHLQTTKPKIQVSDVWLKKMAQETEGLGAGDIKNIFNMAAFQAAQEKASDVTEQYLNVALQKVVSERKQPKQRSIMLKA